MAQPSERQFSPLQLFFMLVGAGLVLTLGSAVLIQLVPIRLFVAGLILGPIMILLGLILPVAMLLQKKYPKTVLLEPIGPKMFAFTCRCCNQRYLIAKFPVGTEFVCHRCHSRQDIEQSRLATEDDLREVTDVPSR